VRDRQRFDAAIAAIDRANADDPETLELDGQQRPKELVHAELVTRWVRRLDPSASEVQLLAARAHHLRRWVVPRESYPPGRAGYLRWRRDQARRQAEEVAVILAAAGYDDAAIAQVQGIIRKEGLATDPAVQTHEDALCLAFLETQLGSLLADLGEKRTVEVLAKTARKMSARGLAEAARLPLSPAQAALLGRALQVAGAGADK
jgi:hypothetical protein